MADAKKNDAEMKKEEKMLSDVKRELEHARELYTMDMKAQLFLGRLFQVVHSMNAATARALSSGTM